MFVYLDMKVECVWAGGVQSSGVVDAVQLHPGGRVQALEVLHGG